tara:strand:- start:310 stop:2484 length:2175 start_codon:yes stop_codon:yes gene_type:complete
VAEDFSIEGLLNDLRAEKAAGNIGIAANYNLPTSGQIYGQDMQDQYERASGINAIRDQEARKTQGSNFNAAEPIGADADEFFANNPELANKVYIPPSNSGYGFAQAALDQKALGGERSLSYANTNTGQEVSKEQQKRLKTYQDQFIADADSRYKSRINALDNESKELAKLYEPDDMSFERKMALAQFGLALASGKSYKGRALPIVAEAGQGLVDNLVKINSVVKQNQKEKKAFEIQNKIRIENARVDAATQRDAEVQKVNWDVLTKGLESDQFAAELTSANIKENRTIYNNFVNSYTNKSMDLITDLAKKQFPDPDMKTVIYFDKLTGAEHPPVPGIQDKTSGKTYVLANPKYGAAHERLFNNQLFVDVTEYAMSDKPLIVSEGGQLPGSEKLGVKDLDSYADFISQTNQYAANLEGLAEVRQALQDFPTRAGIPGQFKDFAQELFRQADVGWMMFTGRFGDKNPNSANFAEDSGKRFYVDQFLDDEFNIVSSQNDAGETVNVSILNDAQRKALQEAVNAGQVVIEDDYQRYIAAKENGQKTVELGDGDSISMEDMDTIFGSKDFYDPVLAKNKVRTQSLIYALARARKASGRLNKDDIERASLSLNIYGKSDLGIQASLSVVQVELQTALEDTMSGLKTATTDLDTNRSRFFTSYISDWIERGYYVPDIYQDFIEQNDKIPQYIKDKARYRNRRNDEIMMIGAGNEYDPGYSVSGTVNSGVPN